MLEKENFRVKAISSQNQTNEKKLRDEAYRIKNREIGYKPMMEEKITD